MRWASLRDEPLQVAALGAFQNPRGGVQKVEVEKRHSCSIQLSVALLEMGSAAMAARNRDAGNFKHIACGFAIHGLLHVVEKPHSASPYAGVLNASATISCSASKAGLASVGGVLIWQFRIDLGSIRPKIVQQSKSEVRYIMNTQGKVDSWESMALHGEDIEAIEPLPLAAIA